MIGARFCPTLSANTRLKAVPLVRCLFSTYREVPVESMQIGLKSRQQTVAPRQLVVRPPLIEAFKRVWDGGPALAARDKVNIFDLVSAMVARAPYHRVCALFASSDCALIVSCKQRPGAQLRNTRGCTRLRNRIRKAAATIPWVFSGIPRQSM